MSCSHAYGQFLHLWDSYTEDQQSRPWRSYRAFRQHLLDFALTPLGKLVEFQKHPTPQATLLDLFSSTALSPSLIVGYER